MASVAKDSEYSYAHFDGCLINLIMPGIKRDKLPNPDVPFPETELPPGDQDDDNEESIKEREDKWLESAVPNPLR